MILTRRPDIERFLKGPDSGVRAALLYGRDAGMVRERADLLARSIVADPDDPFDVSALTTSDAEDEGVLESALTAQSMTGGRRLVRLRLIGERAGPERTAGAALTAHANGDLNPDAFFLIEAGALGRDSPLRKAAEAKAIERACVVMPAYEDEPGDVARLVREGLAADKVSLTNDAVTLLVERLPRDRGVARQEIERLALYLGPGSGAQGDAAMLAEFFGVEPEASLFEAADNAFGGKLGAAQGHLRRARAEGEGGPAAVRAAGMHLAKLRKVATLIAGGADAQGAAKSVGVFWKQEREFLRQVRAWTLKELDRLQPQVLAADRACKTSGAPDDLIAERLVLTIAGRARSLGL
jgi:DNA polymerase III subunit delta